MGREEQKFWGSVTTDSINAWRFFSFLFFSEGQVFDVRVTIPLEIWYPVSPSSALNSSVLLMGTWEGGGR